MKIFKFGGASVKDAASVRKAALIVKNYNTKPLVVVLSAMGKMTNAFEKLTGHWFLNETAQMQEQHIHIKHFHQQVLLNLFPSDTHHAYTELERIFVEIQQVIGNSPCDTYDECYGKLIPYGELLSTQIFSWWLTEQSIHHRLCDA
ncbi:MAG TPA: hypothetical protein VLH16_04745, partial [Bacteroidales bacterium]|nr:hypothetical protein [Bacteroidales bacterium]